MSLNAPLGRPIDVWPQVYTAILEDVKREYPEWDSREQYVEYRKRCKRWKRQVGLR